MATDNRTPCDDMVIVPVGEFTMGVSANEQLFDGVDDWFADARPLRRVWVDAFYIDRCPVTNRCYKAFVDETGHPVPFDDYIADKRPNHECLWDRNRRTYPTGMDEMPVTLVTWHDATAYAAWVGKRLPTGQNGKKLRVVSMGVRIRGEITGTQTLVTPVEKTASRCLA